MAAMQEQIASGAAEGAGQRLLRRLLRLHDAITELGVRLAMTALALIVLAYAWEVVARYFLGAPTRWSADLVGYLLLFVTFMALPMVTALGAHVAVPVLLERLSPQVQKWAGRLIALSGAVVCLFLMKVCADETLRQIERNVRMMAAHPVPKAWISVWIIYGFAGSALHFLRLAIAPRHG
jgi:TRAP-type C4-dicarboxylate transport system permease small subunit